MRGICFDLLAREGFDGLCRHVFYSFYFLGLYVRSARLVASLVGCPLLYLGSSYLS